jgi:broad specificity phosphatase PhoE
VRHAESTYNAKVDEHLDAYPHLREEDAYWASDGVYDPLLFDAPLSSDGVLQAQHLAEELVGDVAHAHSDPSQQGIICEGSDQPLKKLRDTDLAAALASSTHTAALRRVTVVVTSPLTRAIQTAAIVFGALAGRCRYPLRIIVQPLAREILEGSCDVGRLGHALLQDPALAYARQVFHNLDAELAKLARDWWSPPMPAPVPSQATAPTPDPAPTALVAPIATLVAFRGPRTSITPGMFDAAHNLPKRFHETAAAAQERCTPALVIVA